MRLLRVLETTRIVSTPSRWITSYTLAEKHTNERGKTTKLEKKNITKEWIVNGWNLVSQG